MYTNTANINWHCHSVHQNLDIWYCITTVCLKINYIKVSVKQFEFLAKNYNWCQQKVKEMLNKYVYATTAREDATKISILLLQQTFVCTSLLLPSNTWSPLVQMKILHSFLGFLLMLQAHKKSMLIILTTQTVWRCGYSQYTCLIQLKVTLLSILLAADWRLDWWTPIVLQSVPRSIKVQKLKKFFTFVTFLSQLQSHFWKQIVTIKKEIAVEEHFTTRKMCNTNPSHIGDVMMS